MDQRAHVLVDAGTLPDIFNFNARPDTPNAQVMGMATGDSWLAKAANLLMIGLVDRRKSHPTAHISLALKKRLAFASAKAPLLFSCIWSHKNLLMHVIDAELSRLTSTGKDYIRKTA